MDEFALIDRFFARRARSRPDVDLGIGDDAAVTLLPAGSALVIASDAMCIGTHFPPGTPPRALGHRCLAINLSDIAAMGAQPLWCTLTLSLNEIDEIWLTEFADGFFALADAYDTALIGGDTVRGPLTMTVTIHGAAQPNRCIRRDGAGVGEGIFVTGYPGEAGAGCGLAVAASGPYAGPEQALMRRFCYPTPRVREGLSLRGIATAMIDVSDGLHEDLGKLLAASRVGADLSAEALPLSDDLLEYVGEERALGLALTGGDDYELCFTVPRANEQELARVSRDWSCPVTRLGETTAGGGVVWTRDQQPFTVPDTAFSHF
jgi:thiamine-monophosphate kinase